MRTSAGQPKAPETRPGSEPDAKDDLKSLPMPELQARLAIRARVKRDGKCVTPPARELGDAVLGAFVGAMEKIPTVVKLAVRSIPTSGTPAELLGAAGIDAEHIAQAVRECLYEPPHQTSKEGRR